ncbi:MAG: electron transfer flavoprotein subunit beta/FixA family protein [Promethearchaeota archaeon]
MKFIVCIKQIPATSQVHLNPETGGIMRETAPVMMNPVDKHAIEMALSLKEGASKPKPEVIAITMGPPQAEAILKEALAMGVDKSFLITDPKFAGSDTIATSHVLAKAIRHVKDTNKSEKETDFLVFCGSKSLDGETGFIGPQLAEELKIHHIKDIVNIKIKDKKLQIFNTTEDGAELMQELDIPAVISVHDGSNTPRFPTLRNISIAFDNANIETLNAEQLGLDNSRIGIEGSRTQVVKTFIPELQTEKRLLRGETKTMVDEIVNILKNYKII